MSQAEAGAFDTDVVVVGSGFGGAVAALRLAEAGQRVCVLERGPWVTRESNEVDLDALWNPRRHRFGMNELRSRGKTIVPWLGAGVGGGSHVYAGTLKRAESWAGFPAPIQSDDMDAYFDRAESMMDAQYFPDYAPYNQIRATQLLYDVGRELREQRPDVVEDYGPIHLAISFAPEGGEPGGEFVNKHGAHQRYSDPREQSLLGGDIGAKNTLDRNYLHVAQERGVEIRPLCEAHRIERSGDGYRVHYTRYVQEASALRRFGRKWLPWAVPARDTTDSISAKRLVLAAGCVGSTEMLLHARDVHQSLTDLSPTLGSRYTTNGDFISLILPFRGLFVSWLGFIAAIVGLVMWNQWIAIGGGVAYFLGLWASQRPFDPDVGTTNSDFIRFKGPDGATQGAYIESGRYPTPVRFGLALMLSSLGLWRPRRYYKIIRFTHFLQRFVPPFAMLARSWPIPLLKMGRDHSVGTFRLDDSGRAVIDYDLGPNRAFYAYLDGLGRMVARAAKAWWMPNILFKLTKRLEIPHNQGGVPMGESKATGVVDHAGRVFGYRDLMVLDGSILPVSPGPNPALTILAVSERAMDVVAAQLERDGHISADG